MRPLGCYMLYYPCIIPGEFLMADIAQVAILHTLFPCACLSPASQLEHALKGTCVSAVLKQRAVERLKVQEHLHDLERKRAELQGLLAVYSSD